MDLKRKKRYLRFPVLFGGGAIGALGANIILSNNSILESAAESDLIGNLSVVRGNGTYSFSLSLNPGTRYKIANDNELQVNSALDHEANAIEEIEITADNGVDTPLVKRFFVFVLNVIENPVNTTAPVIVGVATVGEILSLQTAGVWEEPDAIGATFAFQWMQVGTPDVEIEGETDPDEFIPGAELEGESVRLRETCTNSAGSVAEVSNSIGPLVAAVDLSSFLHFNREEISGLQLGMI